MGQTLKRWVRGVALLPAFALTGALAYAQEASDLEARLAALEDSVNTSASSYVDNSYLFLLMGLVVMFMAAGFCMLEAGLVRSKNAAVQVTKNVAAYAIAGLMFYLVGYNLLYPGDAWTIATGAGTDESPTMGILGAFHIWAADDSGSLENGYSAGSDHYFQMVFVATAASIVSGTVAERIKLWSFLAFTAVLTGIIYPIQCSWQWGGGWLSVIGFSDFAGSTLVHSTGGWAALMGAIILGPRIGKYFGKQINPMPGSNIPLAALGTFILWFGWFGFNGGSQLAAGDFDDINAVSIIFLNTNTAAAAGTIAAMALTTILYKKVDPTMAFNGALAGLVSITAEPLTPSLPMATLIGAIGGVLVVFAVPLLDKLKIDDVVGAIPVHLFCGIWGTIAVPLTNHDITFTSQIIGIVAIGAFVSVSSAIVWLLIKFTIGIRVSEEEELGGLDIGECGLEAYPEFSKG